MTLDDLTVNFRHLDRESVLSDWRWLVPMQKHAILVTLTGNLFVQDELTGGIDFLDVGAGRLSPVATSMEEFQSLLSDREFVLRAFEVRLVAELLKSGRPSEGRLFGFKRLPRMGGTYDPSNFEETDLQVHFSLCGQLHQQLASLPPGTPVGEVNVGEG